MLTFNLTVLGNISGSTDPSPGVYPETPGAVITVTATPNSGYVLDHWIVNGTQIVYPGDPSGLSQDNWVKAIMVSDQSIQPVFKTLNAMPNWVAPIVVVVGLSVLGYVIYKLIW